MPRQPRLDIPGLLHHVMVRGIERGTVFRDDIDRYAFVKRFQNLLQETETECLAWALLPNHFHLLVRPRSTSLSIFMRRLLTGYAVTFNKRHKRCGHLFQNRYKSIICGEDVYMMELIRYIHLNPFRAKLVSNIESLDTYLWSGHAALLGNVTDPVFSIISHDFVLGLFAETLGSARRNYRRFIVDGSENGKLPELDGGGLQRSLTLDKSGETNIDFDDRILGSGEFVTHLRQSGLLEPDVATKRTLLELQQLLEKQYCLADQELLLRGRKNKLSEVRNLFCYCGVRVLQNSVTEVSHYLKISPSSVTRSARNGAQLFKDNDKLQGWLEQKNL